MKKLGLQKGYITCHSSETQSQVLNQWYIKVYLPSLVLGVHEDDATLTSRPGMERLSRDKRTNSGPPATLCLALFLFRTMGRREGYFCKKQLHHSRKSRRKGNTKASPGLTLRNDTMCQVLHSCTSGQRTWSQIQLLHSQYLSSNGYTQGNKIPWC